MNIQGSHRFEAPREAVFAAIRDPRVLMSVIPGCESVEQVAPDRYDGLITLRLPGAVGRYRTHVTLVDVVEPEQAGLDGSVEGTMGTITGHADFVLRAAPGGAGTGTDMDYRGSGVIGGPLARLDSRFTERLAESLIDQGLRALDLRLATEASE
jgi:carbon monoxide dehydrogenase subunit G